MVENWRNYVWGNMVVTWLDHRAWRCTACEGAPPPPSLYDPTHWRLGSEPACECRGPEVEVVWACCWPPRRRRPPPSAPLSCVASCPTACLPWGASGAWAPHPVVVCPPRVGRVTCLSPAAVCWGTGAGRGRLYRCPESPRRPCWFWWFSWPFWPLLQLARLTRGTVLMIGVPWRPSFWVLRQRAWRRW